MEETNTRHDLKATEEREVRLVDRWILVMLFLVKLFNTRGGIVSMSTLVGFWSFFYIVGVFLFIFLLWKLKNRIENKARKTFVAEYMKFSRDFVEADLLSLNDDEWAEFIRRAAALDVERAVLGIKEGDISMVAVITSYRDTVALFGYMDSPDVSVALTGEWKQATEERILALLAENKKRFLATLEKISPL